MSLRLFQFGLILGHNETNLIPVPSYVRSQQNQFGRSLYVHGRSALFMRYEMRLTVPLLLDRH